MRLLYLLLLCVFSNMAVAQRTVRLEDLTSDSFQERIKSCDLTICDSLIMAGVVSVRDFHRLYVPHIRYLDIKGLLFSDIIPLYLAHDVIHPMLSNNSQQQFSYVFQRHKKLEEVILPDSLKILGRGSFNWCERLKRVVLPPGLLVISEVAFRLCSSLEDITIPESVVVIGGGAFSATKVWNKKKVIQLPPNLEYIGIMHNGSGAKRIEIAKENRFYSSVDGVLFDKSLKRLIRTPPRLKRYVIPATTVLLEESALSNSAIREIIIPDHVKSIGNCCFASCPKLKSVTLPSYHYSLKMGYRMFAYSDKLRTIICKSPIPYHNGKEVLKGLVKTCVIVVPQGAKAAYEQAEGWKDYRIIER